MGEKLDEPRRPDADAEGAPPRFMKTINGWLLGLSGIAVTVVGLRAAVLQLMPGEGAPAKDRAEVSGEPVDTETAVAPPAAAEAPAEEVLPTSYEIPGGTLAFVEGEWVETNDTGTSSFKEVSRDSDGMTVVLDEGRKLYLRWPNKGGKVEWSNPDPLDWTELYYAKAVAPS